MFQDKLNDLIAEHAHIRSEVDLLPALWSSQDFGAFREHLKIILEALHSHHVAEMDVIFTPMQQQPRLREGGPMCTFFFDSRMTFLPIQIAVKILQELGLSADSPIPADLQYYFDANSPLTIPLEEHISQRLIVENLLNFPQLEDPQYFQTVSKALSFLQDVSNTNFAKEERCLFEFARALLSPPIKKT